MDWHSTLAREELLIVLRGRVSVEVEPRGQVPVASLGEAKRRGQARGTGNTTPRAGRHPAHAPARHDRTGPRPRPGPHGGVELQGSRVRRHRSRLRAGECAWLPPQTRHCVVNRSLSDAAYLYVTAPILRESASRV